jgi:hypothetical protein
MNYSYKGLVMLVISVALSCNKEKVDLTSYPATINLVNAIASPDSDIKMNFTGKKITYSDSKNLGYYNYDGKYSNGALTFGLSTGVNHPLNITLARDTTKFIFNQSITCQKGDIYSLFMTGYIDAPTGLLIKDILPQHPDSTTGVRFINLSPNSSSLSVNISGNNNGSEVDNLPYKSYTQFIALPAKLAIENYLFEIRDADTGEQLTAFYYDDIARLKNVTLVIRGSVYGDPGIEVVRINHY